MPDSHLYIRYATSQGNDVVQIAESIQGKYVGILVHNPNRNDIGNARYDAFQRVEMVDGKDYLRFILTNQYLIIMI